MSALCDECAKRAYTRNIGQCGNCDKPTSSGMITLCSKCAQESNTCGFCRNQLNNPQQSTESTQQDTSSANVEQ
jgi:predicted amidophosphoribosyltransferase